MKNEFIHNIIEDEMYLNMDVIDYGKDWVLGFDMPNLKSNGKAHYIYKYNSEIQCDFHLLSEVSQSFQPLFEQAIKKNKVEVKLTETETDIYEILIP
jgi:hypothetical protein